VSRLKPQHVQLCPLETDLEDPFWLPQLELGHEVVIGLSEADLVAGELYELWSIHSQNPNGFPYVFLASAARPTSPTTGSPLERDYGDNIKLGGIISVENGTTCTYIQPVKKPPGKHNDNSMYGLLEVICSHGVVYTTADQLRPYTKRPLKP